MLLCTLFFTITHSSQTHQPRSSIRNCLGILDLIELYRHIEQQKEYQQLPLTPKHSTTNPSYYKINKKNRKSKKRRIAEKNKQNMDNQEQAEQKERNETMVDDNSWRNELDNKFKKLTVAIQYRPLKPIPITSVQNAQHTKDATSTIKKT